jgi:hypothetical protein
MFFLQQNQSTEGRSGFAQRWEGGKGEVAHIMNTHVSKCKNEKIKF